MAIQTQPQERKYYLDPAKIKPLLSEHGALSRAADHIKCQPSELSNMINGQRSIGEIRLARLCQFVSKLPADILDKPSNELRKTLAMET